jgi:hypothetical protein
MFKALVPVKRRRAMLASNPLRNSRSELIATMGRRVSFRSDRFRLVVDACAAVNVRDFRHAKGRLPERHCGVRTAPERTIPGNDQNNEFQVGFVI